MNARKWSHHFFKRMFNEDIWEYEKNRYHSILRRYIGEINGKVLDAACGFTNPYIEKKDLENKFSVGMDIDSAVKDKNKIHNEFIIGDLHGFKSRQEFQLIFSVNTLEHLHDPERVLQNFYHALSDGGTLIIIASQRWHYVSIIERILPGYLKNAAWKILKDKDKMPFPAYYHLCSKKTLISAAERTGFEVEQFMSVDPPPIWFSKVPPVFITLSVLMSVMNRFDLFEDLRGSFLAVLRK